MSDNNNNNQQNGLIIIDDIAKELLLDFESYRDTLCKILKNSYPKFTIGIFGEWGTGKTTLMNSIHNRLQSDQKIVIVRFESWRYEREEQFALIPLLKTIAFSLPDNKDYQELKQKLKRGAINFIKKTPDILSSFLAKQLGDEIGIMTKEMLGSFKKEFDKKLELLTELDKDTLYFDGFKDIQIEINKLMNKDPNFRIIVFVDDLDRCSPKKALEVLESIKVFLGMDGFIYILALSHDIISKLIDIEYKKSGINGEQYIKKIIQIPINLPKWNKYDVISLLKNFVKKGIVNEKYIEIIGKNIELISTAIENNPREIKRFLNDFIVINEILIKDVNLKSYELLLLQTLRLRWKNLYEMLLDDGKYIANELDKYCNLTETDRITILNSDMSPENGKNYNSHLKKILENYKSDSNLWDLLNKNVKTLKNIDNWELYRRASIVGINELGPKSTSEESLKILKSGKIYLFNKKRSENPSEYLDFAYANLKNADLRGANLEDVYLGDALLHNAVFEDGKFENINFENSILTGGRFIRSRLKNINLKESQLDDSYFREADLQNIQFDKANLKGSKIIYTNFVDISLIGADLSNAILINPTHSEIYSNDRKFKVKLDEKTLFNNSIIDDPGFVQFISTYTKHTPNYKIENIKQLRQMLEERGIIKWKIEEYLKYSRLPE
jgi:hypothetical protein